MTPQEKGTGTPGTPFRPSNGAEGGQFEGFYCDRCEKSRETRESEAATGYPQNPCMIQGNALFNTMGEPNYPAEWQYNAEGWGCCTAFEVEK